MSHASSLSKKKKKFKRKRNIKSKKIDKRKRKMLVSKAFYNNTDYSIVIYILEETENIIQYGCQNQRW